MSLESDSRSVQSMIAALYEGISRRPAESPDWERLRPLFMRGARLIPPSPQGGPPEVLDFEGFVERVEAGIRRMQAEGEDRGFCERELANRTERFGNIAHVWSTYASRYSAEGPQPYTRGINSFQLAYHGGRWWVVTIFWDAERADNPIPQQYLP